MKAEEWADRIARVVPGLKAGLYDVSLTALREAQQEARAAALEEAASEYDDAVLEDTKVRCRHVAQRLREIAKDGAAGPPTGPSAEVAALRESLLKVIAAARALLEGK